MIRPIALPRVVVNKLQPWQQRFVSPDGLRYHPLARATIGGVSGLGQVQSETTLAPESQGLEWKEQLAQAFEVLAKLVSTPTAATPTTQAVPTSAATARPSWANWKTFAIVGAVALGALLLLWPRRHARRRRRRR